MVEVTAEGCHLLTEAVTSKWESIRFNFDEEEEVQEDDAMRVERAMKARGIDLERRTRAELKQGEKSNEEKRREHQQELAHQVS